jgi:hemolysin activation/secretion protein
MGNLEVKGNRYFKTSVFEKKISMKKGDPFNYNLLKKNLVSINEHPDRRVRAVLAPAKERGGTDLVLEVEDNLPVHLGLSWDNFGSRFIDRDRYNATLSHNNITGRDDILTFRYQFADEEEQYKLNSLSYLLPVNDDLDIGFSVSETKLNLTKQYEPLISRGKSKLYGIYASQTLIKEDNVILSFNLGFDYKDIFNFQLNQESSRDRLRIIKTSLDFDFRDKSGRTIITNEISRGIPNIMGGLREQDSRASRNGSGGSFTRYNMNLLRLQRMPFDSTLLCKNQIQFSPYILAASEQFQIGGIANVRGYPPAEYVGDSGYSTTWEWSFPPYLIPKDIKMPFSKGKFYDSFRIAAFYDWANVDLRRPDSGEIKKRTLRSPGCGIRLNLPEGLSVRLDFAWSWDNVASDGHHLHKWVEVTKSF